MSQKRSRMRLNAVVSGAISRVHACASYLDTDTLQKVMECVPGKGLVA